MKKIIVLGLTVLMVLSSASVAFAELSSYSKSPVVHDIPNIDKIEIVNDNSVGVEIVGESNVKVEVIKNEKGLIQFYTKDGDGPAVDNCIVNLKVTPYSEKQTIDKLVCKVEDGTSKTGEVSAEDRLVYARTNSANGTDTMGANNFKLWREIIDNAAKQGLSGANETQTKIKNKDMVIVSLFDVSVWCERPTEHTLGQHHCVHNLRITFSDDEMSSLLSNYAGLMHFNRKGEWEYIPSTLSRDAKTNENVIEFQIDCESLSPFAIAAYSSTEGQGAPISPQTGEDSNLIYAGAVIVVLGTAVYFLVRRKDA